MKIKINSRLKQGLINLSELKEFNPKDFIIFITKDSYYKNLLENEYNSLLNKYLAVKMILPNFNKLLTIIQGK